MKLGVKKNLDHIVCHGGIPFNFYFACLNCEDRYEMKVPCALPVFEGALKGYQKTHRNCKKRADHEQNQKGEERNRL